MALLPEERREQYRFLAILLMVGVGALYWMYVYSPRAAALDEREDRLAEIRTQNRTAESRTTDLEELRSELNRYERQFAALKELVPERSEVARLYETIATESQTAGLELVSVTPTEARRDTAGYYKRQSWEMEVEGSYHDVGRFLTRVASLDRIVRPSVQSIQLSGGEGSSGSSNESPAVSVTLNLETYVLAGTDPESGSGGGGGGADG